MRYFRVTKSCEACACMCVTRDGSLCRNAWCGAVSVPDPVEIEAQVFVDFLVRVVLLGNAITDC